jgi:hypothetical protein
MKYIEGRKKDYMKYFKEDRPPMLKQFEDYVKINGILLDGYSIEE